LLPHSLLKGKRTVWVQGVSVTVFPRVFYGGALKAESLRIVAVSVVFASTFDHFLFRGGVAVVALGLPFHRADEGDGLRRAGVVRPAREGQRHGAVGD